MHSIRFSLVVYFLALLAVGLGAVSWFSYSTASRTLREKEHSTRKLIESQCQGKCDEARTALDRRILGQAQTLASMARTTSTHFEGLYPLGMLGTPGMLQGHLLVPLWLAEGTHPAFAARLFRLSAPGFHIEAAEDLVPEVSKTQPQEFFEVFRARGQNIVHSESLEGHSMSLNDDMRKHSDFYRGHWDTVEVRPGVTARRVTLKAMVPRFRSTSLSFTWRWTPDPKKGFFGRGRMLIPPMPPRFTDFQTVPPMIFVQYASDTSLLNDEVRNLEKDRDDSLATLAEDTRAAIAHVRKRLWTISLATFAGILVGGFLLVRLGLAPLARLSEAVSKVSARDFRLKVDAERLPEELKPIAARLTQTLDQLKSAFAREKQAAADISHELRTPLAALLTTLEVALRRQRTGEEYRDLLRDCQGSGEQMMHLVERLLALARLDAGADRLRTRQVDVAELADQCADLVRPLAEARGLQLQVHAARPLQLEADPDKIREVLTNLLHNAIEYNKPAGSVQLTVQRDNGHVLMEVRDTGIGISPQAREHIFERFYRADPSRHSDAPHAGLGLSIVKSYVDLMGGQIDVRSDDAGSTFRIQVPAAHVNDG